jgi:hypothetical protein
MRRGHRPKTKFLDLNYLIETIQCLALATIDLHPKNAFLKPNHGDAHLKNLATIKKKRLMNSSKGRGTGIIRSNKSCRNLVLSFIKDEFPDSLPKYRQRSSHLATCASLWHALSFQCQIAVRNAPCQQDPRLEHELLYPPF